MFYIADLMLGGCSMYRDVTQLVGFAIKHKKHTFFTRGTIFSDEASKSLLIGQSLY